jgi:hypothetical protein
MPPRGASIDPIGRIKLAQFLLPDNVSHDTRENLDAVVKDPLWFLARQWQTGEFEAENGGRPVQLDVEWTETPIDRLERAAGEVPLDPGVPLESVLEAETDGVAPAWDPARLEYRFRLGAPGWMLEGSEYSGRNLDWYHLDLERADPSGPAPPPSTKRFVPNTLSFEGMPHPRWWRFEDGSVNFDTSREAEPNAISTILAEYLLIDSNNWFVFPLEQEAGTIRRIPRLLVADTFGIATAVGPVRPAPGEAPWAAFVLHDRRGAPLAGDVLVLPNVGSTVLEGDLLEAVRFIRDEDANLAWAVEESYFDAARGVRIERADEQQPPPPRDPIAGPAADLPAYRLKSEVAAHWIPYIPMPIARPGEPPSDVSLRRARSIETASRANPQHRGRIVAESARLHEEEIPRLGLGVERLWRFTRGSDGREIFWVGRRRHVGQREASAGLEFDYLE